MATQAQIDAARANGARSRGPLTEEGKAKSSQNAFRHGAFAATVVLASESKEEFEILTGEFIQTFQPANTIEMKLVESMAAATWREQRVRQMEKELLDLTLQEQMPEIDAKYTLIPLPTRTVIAYRAAANTGKTLAALQFAISECGRQYSRALRDLEKVRKIVRNEPKPGPELGKSGNEPIVPKSAHAGPRLVTPIVRQPETGNDPQAATPSEPFSSPVRHYPLES